MFPPHEVARTDGVPADEPLRTVFGMRELGRKGTQFALNGRKTFLRGTLEDFIFPLTGHPPMDVEAWRKIVGAATYTPGYAQAFRWTQASGPVNLGFLWAGHHPSREATGRF